MQKACRRQNAVISTVKPQTASRQNSTLSAGSSRVSLDSFIGSNSACVRNKGTNEEMGMVDKLCCDHRASERVATRLSAFPLGEVATMKATHSDSHSFLSTPVIAAQPLQSDMQYLFTYQNAKSAANREVNMEIITIRVSTNTATEQRAQHRHLACSTDKKIEEKQSD